MLIQVGGQPNRGWIWPDLSCAESLLDYSGSPPGGLHVGAETNTAATLSGPIRKNELA